MNKQILLLSVAVAALAASPVFAPAFADETPDYRDITTKITVPIDTAHATPGDPDGTPGDILLDTGGSVVISSEGQAVVTINSDNAFKAVTGTGITNTNASDATGILVDLTTSDRNATATGTGCTDTTTCFYGITVAGVVDLTGTGDTKKGLWLQGSTTTTDPIRNFFGDVDFTDSTMTITGDSSVGIQIDSLADLVGNLTIGTMTLKPSSSTSSLGEIGVDMEGSVFGDVTVDGVMSISGTGSTAADLVGMEIDGDINGNLTILSTSAVTVVGAGAEGIVIKGNVNPCDVSVNVNCDTATSVGSIVNQSTVVATGISGDPTALSGNAIASSAFAIGGNVAGGFYNAGKTFSDDTTAAASITTSGLLPALLISPAVQGTDALNPIEIKVYQGDTTDPGFGVYNRGNISSTSPNYGDSTVAMFIGGTTDGTTATIDGGVFNSGTIRASAASNSDKSTPQNPVQALALHIAGYGLVGADETYVFTGNPQDGPDGFMYQGNKFLIDSTHDERAALVNSSAAGVGLISATVGGPLGGTAIAIQIDPHAALPSIINSGSIIAGASTSDTTISNLAAFGIIDNSGTLTFIQNNGTIQATATTLDNGDQIAIAIDLLGQDESSAAGDGVLILNEATADNSAKIVGDILFGTGKNQIVDVEGFSTDHTATITGDIAFGGGSDPGSDKLIIGDFATVTGKITADDQLGVSVDIKGGGTLNLENDSEALNAYSFLVEPNGTLNLTVKESFTSGMINAIGPAANAVEFDNGANLNITYGSFVPADSDFVLISAEKGTIVISDAQIDTYNAQLAQDLPFLFSSSTLAIDTADPNVDKLELTVIPKTADELGLTGYAKQILPFANQALTNDDTLGAAFVAGIANKDQAQTAYNEMAPDVTGGARAIAIALTDQSSGPVAARQRILRMYGKASGEVTLWGQEFAEFVQDPGNRSTGQTGFKDHGFGFVLGLDGGDPKTGWYGGALTFYSGDIVEPLPRDSHTNTLWYMLTAYTDWRGKGLFLDTKADIGYMDLKSKRFIDLTIPNASGVGSSKFIDEADGKRPGLVGAIGLTTGAVLAYGSTVITPQISLDGMTMREEGYTETHASPSATTGNGKGMLLQAQSYYASSARIFIGTEIREDLNFGDFFVQPDVRLGYRYDFLNDPTKLRVNFADVGTNSTPTPGPVFTVVGPDPAQGNFVAGASLSTTTDAWTLGANFDFVRGNNGATTEVGTIHLLGRI
ncbi:MAG TPA: autotransporter domain-containing protein [Rhizomicrobium sp.]|nr:autotransporter domain-containing protein [Rhizomicrobium sp.]